MAFSRKDVTGALRGIAIELGVLVVLLIVGGVILLLVLWLVIESFIAFARHRGKGIMPEEESGETI